MEDILLEAAKKVCINDSELIRNKMEWATAHRLAVYIENSFPGFNVDCEYNKMGSDFDPKHDSYDRHKRPDIVIHRRGRIELEHNLLVIEIKLENDQDDDEQKLVDFTSPPNKKRPFQYQYALKISFLPKLQLKWFENGFNYKMIIVEKDLC